VTAFGGVGVAVYALAWGLIPAAPGSDEVSVEQHRRRRAWRLAATLGLLAIAGLLTLRHFGLWPGDLVVAPLVLASAGLALMLRHADAAASSSPADLRHPVRRLRARGGRGSALGTFLIVAAAVLLLRSAGELGRAGHAIGGIIVIFAAFALVIGPLLARLARSLADERSQRIRSQERAELAAHLHDSVLQTLALIQTRAEDPREVATLARRQERELRDWLLGREPRPSESLAAALEQAAAEVEERHRVVVEVVTVGDCPLDENLQALVGAAKEALTNAAKFSGADRVDLYAEVSSARLEVFVRDRGAGFDPEAVPADRRGVRDSIEGRMQRHGGAAQVRTAPGAGTEIALTLERRPGPAATSSPSDPAAAATPVPTSAESGA
jgi:signal transduction histidine kinase